MSAIELQSSMRHCQSCNKWTTTVQIRKNADWQILRNLSSSCPVFCACFDPPFHVPNAQKHLRWTMLGPFSSYSALAIHIAWKVESEAKMDPPIQTEYFRSGGATTLIFILWGARFVISFCIRSEMPANMVVPACKGSCVSSWHLGKSALTQPAMLRKTTSGQFPSTTHTNDRSYES